MFRRQHAIHPYVADFACMAARVLIEIDGNSHNATETYDHQREVFLQKQGYSILRFSNNDVVNNTEGVVQRIILCVEERLNSLPPCGEGKKGCKQ